MGLKLKPLLSTAVIGALLLSSASGCSFSDLSFDGMLRPPRTMGDEAEIEKLISDTAANGYTLKYPKSGSHRSAIIMNDLDGDDVEEAIAFFRSKDDVTGIHMLIMCEKESVWEISGDFIVETSDVDRVDFADIDDNDSLEILVGFATYTPNISFLSCYSYENGRTTEITSGQNYSEFYCGNLNSDNKSEVITLSLYNAETQAKATMLNYNSDKKSLYVKASVNMDPNIVKYKNVTYSDIGEGFKGVVVDGETASGELNTQVIYFNEELSLLRNPLYSEKGKNITQRSCPILSADIDNDQIIDIPTALALPNADSDASLTVLQKLSWNNFSAKSELLTPKYSTAANFAFNFSVKMPEGWENGKVTAVSDDENAVTEFYEVFKNKLTNKLFEIKVFDVLQWDKGQDIDGYSLIYKDNRYAYAFINFETESQYALTDVEIKTAFSVLSDSTV